MRKEQKRKGKEHTHNETTECGLSCLRDVARAGVHMFDARHGVGPAATALYCVRCKSLSNAACPPRTRHILRVRIKQREAQHCCHEALITSLRRLQARHVEVCGAKYRNEQTHRHTEQRQDAWLLGSDSDAEVDKIDRCL